jgi:two-component system, LytTR family, response regulator
MIDVLVVDDEPMARARLRRLIEATTDLRIRAECASGEEALAAIDEHHPHVIFLDVDMPGLSGFDVIEALAPDRRPLVVFVTAYDEFAVRAFEVHALDYLLKPYDPERFAATLERLRERLAGGAGGAGGAHADATALAALLEQVRTRGPERLVVRSGHDLVFVPVRDIDWIGSADNYVELHVGTQVHLLRETLSNVERRLSPAAFARIRRDAIVNLERVRRVRPREDGDFELVLHDGRSLRLGRTYRARVTERWQGA